MATLLETLAERGMVHDATPELAARLATGAPMTGYVGFDPTADSLHVGNLIPAMALAWLQRLGGRPIALVGGGTAMVGDPSGRRSERPVLARDVVAANAAAIRIQLERLLDFSPGIRNAATMVDNAEWLAPLDLLGFLRDTGKHFTVNYMLQKEAVKSRMDEGISFTEFAYMLVQAYDFAHLAHARGCELQLGGSDQWGNITAGIELAARRDGAKLHGLVLPLLTTTAGTKFGKSESGNVWLDPARTSPYAFHQFWLHAEDADVERLLRFFTFLELEEIAAVMREHAADPGRRVAQRRLADAVTARIHGSDVLRRAAAAGDVLFGAGDIRGADADTLALVAAEVPTHAIDRGALDGGLPIADALVMAGLASSKGDARRGLAARGFSINGEVCGEERLVTAADVLAGGVVLLRKGKRTWAALEVLA
jgi:tyrosyl-tRNA synthetase